jgi:hypothetical protein
MALPFLVRVELEMRQCLVKVSQGLETLVPGGPRSRSTQNALDPFHAVSRHRVSSYLRLLNTGKITRRISPVIIDVEVPPNGVIGNFILTAPNFPIM